MFEELRELEKKLIETQKELKDTKEMLNKFDNEVNKYHNVLQNVKRYCLKTHMTIEEYNKLVKMIGE